MPEFTYTYDLNEVDRLTRLDDATPPHSLLSGFTHIQELTQSIKKGREATADSAESENKPVNKKPLTEEEEEARNRESEVRAYLEGNKTLGRQFARDLNRVDYTLKGAANTTGNDAASVALAQEFMKDLTEPQKLLLDQSQGLANPTIRFLVQNLNLPNQVGLIGNKTGITPSAIISKEGDVIQIERTDNFYMFTTESSSENLGTFFYKESGKEIKSVSIDENDELLTAIDKAIKEFAKKPFDPKNPQIKIEYPKGVFINIEPIITVNNEIRMGKTAESLNWKTRVTAHSDKVKIKDGIFDKNKHSNSAGSLAFQVVASVLLVLAFAGLAAVAGLLAGTLIGSIFGGPAGAVIGGIIGASVAGVVMGGWMGANLFSDIFKTKNEVQLSAPVIEDQQNVNRAEPEVQVAPSKTVENTDELGFKGKWKQVTTQFKKSGHFKKEEKPSSGDAESEKPSSSPKKPDNN